MKKWVREADTSMLSYMMTKRKYTPYSPETRPTGKPTPPPCGADTRRALALCASAAMQQPAAMRLRSVGRPCATRLLCSSPPARRYSIYLYAAEVRLKCALALRTTAARSMQPAAMRLKRCATAAMQQPAAMRRRFAACAIALCASAAIQQPAAMRLKHCKHAAAVQQPAANAAPLRGVR